MAVAYIEREYHLNGIDYLIELEVYALIVDESFSHEFGVHDPGHSAEIIEFNIVTVYDDEGDVITGRTVLNQLENIIDIEDFDDVEFNFED